MIERERERERDRKREKERERERERQNQFAEVSHPSPVSSSNMHAGVGPKKGSADVAQASRIIEKLLFFGSLPRSFVNNNLDAQNH